jgi:hypothetical protein
MENLGDGRWRKHMIDDTWSQAHALTMVDLNGDGRPDFITGKRYMAHNGADPGEREPLGVYWYEYFPKQDGSVEWVKHIVTTVLAPARACRWRSPGRRWRLRFRRGGKSGLFLFENLTRAAARAPR